ncbi:hypothetical protein AAG906_000205 [Vitis piasezkii]
MAYRRRSIASSIADVFTISPLPYPVLLILAVILIFFSISWYVSYDSIIEAAEVQMSWALLAIPILLLMAVHLVSSMENSDLFSASSPYGYRRRSYYRPQEGSSPWGVAALIVLLLIMVQYQSVFHDRWLV